MRDTVAGTAIDAQVWDTEARQAFAAGEFTRARQLFEQVLMVWRSLNNTDEIIYALLHITQMMLFEPGYNPAAARLLLEEAWQFAQQPGMEACHVSLQINFAVLALEEKDYRKALHLGQQLLSEGVQAADPERMTGMLWLIGMAIAGLGHAEEGLRLYAAAAALRSRLGVPETPRIFLEHHQRLLAPACVQLGSERIARVEEEGQTLTLEQAVAYALAFSSLP